MRKICVFTGTRAEYGLLKPLITAIKDNPDLNLQLLVSGMHLSAEFGHTYKEIEDDGFEITEKVEMLLSSDTSAGISKSVGLGLISFCDSLNRLSPNMLVILGDRFEAFSIASAAMLCRIPIAHLHGGEATYGLIDEPIRHSITKMSHLHFTSTEEYRQRVIQLGERPHSVFNVGAIGVENIRNLDLLGRKELEEQIDFTLPDQYILVTFHPVTLENNTSEEQFQNLLTSLENFPELGVIFTKSNSDTDGRIINKMIDSYVSNNSKSSISFTSMGQLRYLSALKHASAVAGNSSSGIIEAPTMGIPTINIGDRQKGRTKAGSIIDCSPTQKEISQSIDIALSPDFRSKSMQAVNPYEKAGTVDNIIMTLEEYDLSNILKKNFYDLNSL